MVPTAINPSLAFARCTERDARFARTAASDIGTFARDASRKTRRTAARLLTQLSNAATAAARTAGFGDELADQRMWSALKLAMEACAPVGNLLSRDRFVREAHAALTRAHAAATAADARIDGLVLGAKP